MAEVLGVVASGVTLAALFKACIEAFDLIQTGRHQEADLKKLKLRLNIEKCRLYIWGEMMGIADTSDSNEERPIDRVRFPDVVRDILRAVFDLFHDSQTIKERYGCRQATSGDLIDAPDQDSSNRSLAASFSNFSIRPSHNSRTSKVLQKLVWVIHDRKKFAALVAEIKDLIDSLQGITTSSVPVTRQEGRMRRKIADIRDSEALSLIAEVCSDDHPDVAEIASTKADTISSATTSRHHVVAWIEDIQESQEGGNGERMSPDLESLTVAELKQKLLEMMQEQKERIMTSISAPEPSVIPPPATSLAYPPPGPHHHTKVPNNSSALSTSSSTGEDSVADNHGGRVNGYGNLGYGYLQGATTDLRRPTQVMNPAKNLDIPNTPRFTNPWQSSSSSTKQSTPSRSPVFGAPPPLPPSGAHPHQHTDPVSSPVVQMGEDLETPRNIYQMQRQQVPIET